MTTHLRVDDLGLPYPPSVDDIAAALEQEPILVDQLYGNGDTAGVREGFADLAAQSDYPVYVVLVATPEDPRLPEEGAERALATLLSDTVGEGYFAIGIDPYYGKTSLVAVDVPEISTYAVNDKFRVDPGQGDDRDESLIPSDVGRLARELDIVVHNAEMDQATYDSYAAQAPWANPPQWSSPYDREPAMPGTYFAHGTMALIVVAAVTWLVVRSALTWRPAAGAATKATKARTARARGSAKGSGTAGQGASSSGAADALTALDVPELRRRVESELDDLSAARAAAVTGSFDEDRTARIDAAHQAALSVLARARSRPRDLPDVVGALVLTRRASLAVKSDGIYRPCFFDPRHGRGIRRRTVALGAGEVKVAACRTCAREANADLRPLRVGKRAYYELESVWASTGYGSFVDDLEQQVLTDLTKDR